MGRIKHDAVIITRHCHHNQDNDGTIVAFLQSMPEKFRHLIVGPVNSAINVDMTYVFCPDGSKEGWRHSDECEELRRVFINTARHAGWDVVSIRYGGDDPDITAKAWHYSHESEPTVSAFAGAI